MDFSALLPDLIEKWTGSYADLVFSLIGVAAALAAKGGVVPRAVNAEAVRQTLIARGVKL